MLLAVNIGLGCFSQLMSRSRYWILRLRLLSRRWRSEIFCLRLTDF